MLRGSPLKSFRIVYIVFRICHLAKFFESILQNVASDLHTYQPGWSIRTNGKNLCLVFCRSEVWRFQASVVSFSNLSGTYLAKVSSIFKNGLKSDLNNYQPIPAMVKSFEKDVYDQLYDYLDENALLSNCQSLFYSLHVHSTLTSLLEPVVFGCQYERVSKWGYFC